jgi:hypothetical protein
VERSIGMDVHAASCTLAVISLLAGLPRGCGMRGRWRIPARGS